MDLHTLIDRPGTELGRVVGQLRPDQLGRPTPCAEYDVRALLNHVMWVLEGCTEERDRVVGDWAAAFATQLDKVLATWREPGTWAGSVEFAGKQSPGSLAGSLLFCDLTLHGWDLARATGQPYHCDDEVAEAVLAFAVQMADQGRQMGAFGPEVPVPASAPTFDRALGLSGRDPGWAPTR